MTALIVPKNLGYAGIAGIPLQNGLYAAAAGAIIYALFCTSRQISTGPSSSLAAVAGGAVVATGLGGAEAAQLVAAITLATGVLFVLLAVFRLGRIAQFLSQGRGHRVPRRGRDRRRRSASCPKLTGTDAEGKNAWRELSSWLGSLDDVHGDDAARRRRLAGGDLRAAGRRAEGPRRARARRRRAARVRRSSTSAPTASRWWATCRAACPTPALPGSDLVADHAATILTAAVALLLIGFSQTAGDARAFATRHRYRIDVNQESLAQGMANVGAGVFQGMPVSTSLSASSLNESAGARTPLASLITGALVLLTLIVLAPLFSELPKPVLGALIIDAVVMGMIDVTEFRRLYRVKRFDFAIAIVAVRGRAVGRRPRRRAWSASRCRSPGWCT